jgi:two-component system, OmpR family, phosphate regulon sensor histidine kinase PhoR
MVQFENAVGLEQRGQNLQRTSDFQAALLGMAGHDLRQPLQVIQSAYEWLGSKVSVASEHTRLERGERAIERLTEQLDTLICALRLNELTHDLEISSVKLAPVLSKIGPENEDDAWEKGVELRVCPTSTMVMSDAVLLEGALRIPVKADSVYVSRRTALR